MDYPTLSDTIGQTPMVKLQRIVTNPLVTVLLKLEFFNPGGSIKDRMVKHILQAAIATGALKPGGTVIENTSGNTGAAVAMLCAIYGYRAILTMPAKVSQEKQNALKAFGAEIIVTPTRAPPGSPEHYISVAKRLANEIPNSFRINQYDNLMNPEAHYLSTAPEIWQQCQGKVDLFIASASTGGTISGVGRYLKERSKQVKVVMPDPLGSIYYDYFKTGKVKKGSCTYQLEGIGEDHLAQALDFSVVDEVVPVTDTKAFAMTRRLATEEGILAGGSTGANVWCALEISRKLTQPTTIVTIAPDGGIKYLSKIFDDVWMKEHNLLKSSELL